MRMVPSQARSKRQRDFAIPSSFSFNPAPASCDFTRRFAPSHLRETLRARAGQSARTSLVPHSSPRPRGRVTPTCGPHCPTETSWNGAISRKGQHRAYRRPRRGCIVSQPRSEATRTCQDLMDCSTALPCKVHAPEGQRTRIPLSPIPLGSLSCDIYDLRNLRNLRTANCESLRTANTANCEHCELRILAKLRTANPLRQL